MGLARELPFVPLGRRTELVLGEGSTLTYRRRVWEFHFLALPDVLIRVCGKKKWKKINVLPDALNGGCFLFSWWFCLVISPPSPRLAMHEAACPGLFITEKASLLEATRILGGFFALSLVLGKSRCAFILEAVINISLRVLQSSLMAPTRAKQAPGTKAMIQVSPLCTTTTATTTAAAVPPAPPPLTTPS